MSLTVWAPGRINLIGEHTDYSGGLALPAAIQLGVTLTLEAREDEITVPSDAAPFAEAVAHELAELGRPRVGMVASIESDLPVGAGLSSSAALEVALALALCTIADFTLDPLDLARACQRAELRAVGVPCGILDQAACVLGEEGKVILLDCGTLEHSPIPCQPRLHCSSSHRPLHARWQDRATHSADANSHMQSPDSERSTRRN
jgi:galactokinase